MNNLIFVYDSVIYKLKPLAAFFIVAHAVYYYTWSVIYPQEYENPMLRMFCVFICIPLMFLSPLQKRTGAVYLIFSITLTGPFFFSFMLIKNLWSPVWVLSEIAMLLLLILFLVDWKMILFSFAAGFGIAAAAVFMIDGRLCFKGSESMYIPIYAFLLIGAMIVQSERLEDKRRLVEQASHDFLTGLYNRSSFFSFAVKEQERSQRGGSIFSIIIFDIDFFKKVNDSHGHAAGDLVLKNVAEVARNALRCIDIPARFGGEEFIALLPETNKQSAIMAAERLRLAVSSSFVTINEGITVSVTISLGVAEHAPGSSINATIELADKALYNAKNSGRNKTAAI